MSKMNLNSTIIIMMMVLFCIAVVMTKHATVSSKTLDDISIIPLNIGEWKGEEISVEKNIKDILETDAVLMRQYTHPDGSEIVLAIVFYKDSRVALHLPESCLTGQGTKLISEESIKITAPDNGRILANQLITKSRWENNLVLYFFETGDLMTSSYFSFRKHMLLSRLVNKPSSGALVRFSIKFKEEDFNFKKESLIKFIKNVARILPKYLI